ncbi:Ocs element-binding factor 1 [Zostera marina]|uniref:Ocs element-binding factor 1 n=1 Tax=Zostera marina TaxID=29655 RepID=A0A0K9NXP1_ZOSMR|nr:Ocs element-binding factor 1 [Zostera marina]
MLMGYKPHCQLERIFSSPSATTGGSCSDGERRKRRMTSNRESARRSRMRKQKHVEELEGVVVRLELENREVVKRIGTANQYSLLFNQENHRLRLEQLHLRQRLADVQGILAFQQELHLDLSMVCSGKDTMNLNGFEQTLFI